MNADANRNPKRKIQGYEGEGLPDAQDSGGTLKVSGTTRLMQRPLLMQRSKVEGGGGALELRRREEEEEVWKGKKGKGPRVYL